MTQCIAPHSAQYWQLVEAIVLSTQFRLIVATYHRKVAFSYWLGRTMQTKDRDSKWTYRYLRDVTDAVVEQFRREGTRILISKIINASLENSARTQFKVVIRFSDQNNGQSPLLLASCGFFVVCFDHSAPHKMAHLFLKRGEWSTSNAPKSNKGHTLCVRGGSLIAPTRIDPKSGY